MSWTIALTIMATLVAAALAMNFATPEKKIQKKVEHRHGVADPQFRREMSVLLGPAIIAGNRVQAFHNGDEIFPAMIEAIRGARSNITMETYIYWSGEIGRKVADALCDRASRRVPVHLVVDWAGSLKMEDELLELMQGAGVRLERLRPLRWYHLGRMNNRTHRKLLIVDGRIGFTGGVGIADLWNGDAQDPKHWRDTHFRIEGPAVAQMQSAFLDNWVEVTGEVLHGEPYFPPVEKHGEHYAQVFTSSPGGGAESMQLMYLLSIAAAARSIDLSASYFVPDDVSVNMFVAALERGVKVQIILPGPHIDTEIVRRASRSTWGKLLRAGAEIYEYQPTMFHCKV